VDKIQHGQRCKTTYKPETAWFKARTAVPMARRLWLLFQNMIAQVFVEVYLMIRRDVGLKGDLLLEND